MFTYIYVCACIVCVVGLYTLTYIVSQATVVHMYIKVQFHMHISLPFTARDGDKWENTGVCRTC